MIGEALRLIRVFHDLKSGELAKELGISPSYLSEIENGKKAPSLELLEQYARIFKTKPSSILFFSEDLDQKNLKTKGKDFIRKRMIRLLQMLERKDEIED